MGWEEGLSPRNGVDWAYLGGCRISVVVEEWGKGWLENSSEQGRAEDGGH